MFDLWVGKIPWRREQLPTPAFWPGEFPGLYSPWGSKESDMIFTFTLINGPSEATGENVQRGRHIIFKISLKSSLKAVGNTG